MEITPTRTLPRSGFSVNVGLYSELVMPGTPEWYLNNPAGVVDWATGIFVYRNDICRVRSATAKIAFYVCTAFGTTGNVKPVHLDGVFHDGGVVNWRRLHFYRNVLRFKNTATAGTICLSRGKTAVLNAGIALSALESYTEGLSGIVTPYEGPWYGISDSAGGRLLAVSEG